MWKWWGGSRGMALRFAELKVRLEGEGDMLSESTREDIVDGWDSGGVDVVGGLSSARRRRELVNWRVEGWRSPLGS